MNSLHPAESLHRGPLPFYRLIPSCGITLQTGFPSFYGLKSSHEPILSPELLSFRGLTPRHCLALLQTVSRLSLSTTLPFTLETLYPMDYSLFPYYVRWANSIRYTHFNLLINYITGSDYYIC